MFLAEVETLPFLRGEILKSLLNFTKQVVFLPLKPAISGGVCLGERKEVIPMRLTRQEQETVINFDNGSQTASIYTASPQMMRKLDALAAAYPEHYRLTGETEVSKTYSCDKSLVSLRKPRKQNEAHREWARERMRQRNLQKKARISA